MKIFKHVPAVGPLGKVGDNVPDRMKTGPGALGPVSKPIAGRSVRVFRHGIDKPRPGPRHATQTEWTEAVVAVWSCRYGCRGSSVDGERVHHYLCAYWRNEGRVNTPF